MPGTLLYKNTIAGAVAREVARGGRDGLAYKAALVRQLEQSAPVSTDEQREQLGTEFSIQLCSDAARDAQLMNELVAPTQGERV